MKSSITVSIVMLLILFPAFAFSASAHTDRVVAVVNDDVITLSELNKSFIPILERIKSDPRTRDDPRMLNEGKRFVLDRMINNLIMKQEAEQLNIVVEEEDIDAYIDDMLKNRNMTRKELLEGLAEEGTTVEEHRETIRREILKSILVGREIRARVSVSDEDIGDYYREHRERYEGKQAVRIQQLLAAVPRDADDETRQSVRARAEKIRAMLASGESFDAMVAHYSDGPEAQAGGDLGFIEKGMILPDVEEVAFSLEKGAISDIIESPAGFHIIRVIDRRGAGLKPLEEVRQEIIDEIAGERMEQRFQNWLEDLRAKAYVEIRL